MGVVEQPIADGVGHGSVSKLVIPVLDAELAGEDGGAGAVAVVEDLEQISGRVLSALPADLAPAIELASITGFRIGAIRSLTWAHVGIGHGILRLSLAPRRTTRGGPGPSTSTLGYGH